MYFLTASAHTPNRGGEVFVGITFPLPFYWSLSTKTSINCILFVKKICRSIYSFYYFHALCIIFISSFLSSPIGYHLICREFSG